MPCWVDWSLRRQAVMKRTWGAVWNLLPASAMVGIDWGYPARQSEVPGQTSPDEPAGMDQVTSDQAKPVTMCVQQHHNL